MWYWTKVLFLIIVGAIIVWGAYEFFTFPNISKLRTENPTTSSLIEYRIAEAREAGQEPRKYMVWQPIEQISPHLQRAVLAGEDARFFEHDGFDWKSIEKAWDEAQKEGEKEAKAEGDYDPESWIPPMPSFKRGASTISQQLAKNLYLSEERNFLRKGREAAITYFLERELSKKTDYGTLSQHYRMGRRHLRRGSGSQNLFQKVRVFAKRAGSRVSFGDDSKSAECI
jgi:monofunctional biosynthetic peptidoglycan transglycosylase